MNDAIYDVSSRRELFYDDFMLECRDNLEFKLHTPVERPADPGKPGGAYVTVLRNDRGYRMYYRRTRPDYDGPKTNGNPGEYVAVAESPDGLVWTSPEFNFFPNDNVPKNTIIYGKMFTEGVQEMSDPLGKHKGCMSFTHNFVPIYDDRPGVPADERYKAVSGILQTGGLFTFHSADGIRWKRYDDFPAVKYDALALGGHALDSQNVAFYSEVEKCFVLYFRVWRTSDDRKGLRSFAKCVSQDFRHWSGPELLNPNREGEHLYVSGFRPYDRAPQYYIGAATRFFQQRGAATDVTLIFSREGQGVQRPFPGAWIVPGPDPVRWGNRNNYIAWGMVQSSKEELSLYHGHQPIRFTLRTDGFTSLAAGVDPGECLTKVLKGDFKRIEINLATSAAGAFQLELCDPAGQALDGFTFADFGEFYGDTVDLEAKWGDKVLPAEVLAKGFRLRIRMTECDLYSIAFL